MLRSPDTQLPIPYPRLLTLYIQHGLLLLPHLHPTHGLTLQIPSICPSILLFYASLQHLYTHTTVVYCSHTGWTLHCCPFVYLFGSAVYLTVATIPVCAHLVHATTRTAYVAFTVSYLFVHVITRIVTLFLHSCRFVVCVCGLPLIPVPTVADAYHPFAVTYIRLPTRTFMPVVFPCYGPDYHDTHSRFVVPHLLRLPFTVDPRLLGDIPQHWVTVWLRLPHIWLRVDVTVTPYGVTGYVCYGLVVVCSPRSYPLPTLTLLRSVTLHTHTYPL